MSTSFYSTKQTVLDESIASLMLVHYFCLVDFPRFEQKKYLKNAPNTVGKIILLLIMH